MTDLSFFEKLSTEQRSELDSVIAFIRLQEELKHKNRGRASVVAFADHCTKKEAACLDDLLADWVYKECS